MKKTLTIFSILLSLFLVGCTVSNTSTKAVEDGKIALVSKEYEKSKDLFKLAVSEDSKNTEAKSLLDLVTNYIDLMSINDNNEYDKVDDIISKIEKNDKLDIIKDEFTSTKNNILTNREKFNTYIKDVESIEILLKENKIDDAKTQATSKLEEVKGIKSLEDRLNSVITAVDEIINNAKLEILNNIGYQTDMQYNGMKLWDNTYFSVFKKLSGKTMLSFDEIIEDSPAYFMYDLESKNSYEYTQGSVYLLNNGKYEELYGYKDYLKEQEEIAKSKIKISTEEAENIIVKYFLSNHPFRNADEIFASVHYIQEDNEYLVTICSNSGNYKAVAEYYVNASNGDIRVLWE